MSEHVHVEAWLNLFSGEPAVFILQMWELPLWQWGCGEAFQCVSVLQRGAGVGSWQRLWKRLTEALFSSSTLWVMLQRLGLIPIRSGIQAVHFWWQRGCFAVAKRRARNATVSDGHIWYPKCYHLQSTWASSDVLWGVFLVSFYFHVPHLLGLLFFLFFLIVWWRRLWLHLGWSGSGGNVRGRVMPDEFTTERAPFRHICIRSRVFEHHLGHSTDLAKSRLNQKASAH